MGSSSQLKSPSYFIEIACLSTNLFFVKFISQESYDAMTFFTILLPFMVYLVVTLFGSLLKFLQLLHTEDAEDETQFLSSKQKKIVSKVMRNLALYFGVYFLSAELDKWMKIVNFEHINILPALIGINAFFAI